VRWWHLLAPFAWPLRLVFNMYCGVMPLKLVAALPTALQLLFYFVWSSSLVLFALETRNAWREAAARYRRRARQRRPPRL
jgi:hypothetical protein